MVKEAKMKRVLGFMDFFPNESPNSKIDYANKLGIDILEKFCCHFLSYFRNKGIPELDFLLREWFTFNEHKYDQSPSYFYIESEYRRIRNFHQNEEHEIIVVESLLNMYLWLQENKASISEIEVLDASATIPLFKLYLLFNDELLERYDRAAKSVEEIDDGRQLQRIQLALSFPQSDLTNIDYAQLFYTQMYKQVRLLKFLTATEKYQPLLNQLLSDFKCKTSAEYVKGVGAALVQSIRTNGPGWVVLNTVKSEDRTQAENILNQLAIDDKDTTDDQNDYLQLRSKPFQKIAEGQYRVVFDLFLIKKIYNGLIFKFSSYDKDFLGHIREDFSEGVLVYETLKCVLNSESAVMMTGSDFKAKLLEREPDFYFEDHDDILLFESKDFFMPGKSKLSYNFQIIEGELMKDGRLKKAVKQLSKNIERCILKQLPVDKDYNLENLRLFPIIITHDSLYNAAALNYWVHYWLLDEIEGMKSDTRFSQFDFSRIMPLTIIDIDTLILYQNQFKEREMDLIRLIESYHDYVRFDLTGKVEPRFIEKHANQSAIPFSEFVRGYAHEKNIQFDFTKVSELLMEYGVK